MDTSLVHRTRPAAAIAVLAIGLLAACAGGRDSAAQWRDQSSPFRQRLAGAVGVLREGGGYLDSTRALRELESGGSRGRALLRAARTLDSCRSQLRRVGEASAAPDALWLRRMRVACVSYEAAGDLVLRAHGPDAAATVAMAYRFLDDGERQERELAPRIARPYTGPAPH